MYDELVKRLRRCAVYLPEKFSKNAETLDVLMKAADAIEQLTADLERSKEWETFWEKEANEALKKFQTAVANKPRWIPVTERLPQENGRYLTVAIEPWFGTTVVDTMRWSGVWMYDGRQTEATVTHWMPLPQEPGVTDIYVGNKEKN